MKRYIDAEVLQNVMYHEAFETDTEMQRWDSGCWIRYKLFENILEQQKTADVRENITGKWLRYREDGEPDEVDTVFWQCSECLEMYIGRTTRIPKFCPNCGANMIKNSIKEGE